MARAHNKHTKRTKRTKRTRTKRMRGGSGAGYEPGAPLLPGTQLGEQVHQRYDGCMSVDRPGQIAFSSSGGLPGMRGGGYTNNLGSGIAGFAQIDKVPCDTALTGFNPLNKHFAQAGGAGVQSAADMGVYVAPNAGYIQTGSAWRDSVGAPVLLNVPYDGNMISRACVQTAGRRHRHRRSHSKKGKSKKSRKTKKPGHRGGGMLEDALKALADEHRSVGDLITELTNGPVTKSMGGFTFKAEDGKLYVRKDNEFNSSYTELSDNPY